MALPWIALWCDTPRDPEGSPDLGTDCQSASDAKASARASRVRVSADLAIRLRAREEDAYRELVQTMGKSLVTFAASMVRSQDIAEDVVQEVLIRVWRLGDALEVENHALADYLFRAVRNASLTALRSNVRASRARDGLAREIRAAEERDVTNRDTEWEGEISHLRAVLATLTPHQRAAIALRYGERMPIARIAQILEISEKGAEQLLVRVRKLLRERLEPLR